jgi:hypothetical protein
VKRLDPEKRDIAVALRIKGLFLPEIAEQLDISISTVHKWTQDIKKPHDVSGQTFGSWYVLSKSYFDGSGTLYTAADEKIWQVLTGRAANSLSFESVNDAESVANSWMTVERSGATPTNLYFSNVRVGVGDSAPGQALTVKSAADSLQAVGIYDSRTQAANVGGSMAIGGRYLDGSTGLTTAVEYISYILV